MTETLLDDHAIANDFFKYLRTFVLPIRPSQYDLSTICNLYCEGCLFFSGSDYKGHVPEDDLSKLNTFFQREASRGVNYVEVAGAEPSLIEHKLKVMARHIPKGVIYTNGTKRITSELDYRLQISLWGLPEESKKLRGADIVQKQVRNYRDDARAIFVFTINGQNVRSIPAIAAFCVNEGIRLSFNHYSPTDDYLKKLEKGAGRDGYFRFSQSHDNMLLTADDLAASRELISEAMEGFPNTVLYSQVFNDWVHQPEGLYEIDLITRIAKNCGARVTTSYRHFHADLSDAGDVKCCTPNVECSSCRLYAQSLGSALQKLTRTARKGIEFNNWMKLWRLWHILFWGELPERFSSEQKSRAGG
ncbi:MAG: hypothetical protein ACRECW_15100 [Phyllobacterium sp.]